MRTRAAGRFRKARRAGRTIAAFALAALAALAQVALAGEVVVAVAANFAGPMTRIADAFTAASGHTVTISAGATGRFYSQIVAGAPFDVLLAADDETPARLIAEGHGVAGSRFTYAIGQLVLWSARPGLVDDQGAVLASDRFKHLAIASPRLAPYGRAAMELLRARGLTEAIAPRLVTAESIAQAYQFAVSGNAELSLVALSQVAAPDRPATGSLWRVPQALYGEIRQDAVLLKAGARNPAAETLLAWLRGPAAGSVIRAYGYRR